MSSVEAFIDSHPLLPLISILIDISMSENFDYCLIKRLSNELIKMQTTKTLTNDQDSFNYRVIDLNIKYLAKRLLQDLATLLQNLISAEEVFEVLAAANEPFKKTRRRLPPGAEAELTDWLKNNSKHPYMSDEGIEEFCERYEGVEEDQIRIFLTNARRKMSEGVRKRSRSN